MVVRWELYREEWRIRRREAVAGRNDEKILNDDKVVRGGLERE